MMKHYQKITAPIHRSTAYDFNVQLDHVSLNKENNTILPYTPDTEVLGVKEHEILVRYQNAQHRYKDNRLRVFSALNNLIYNKNMLLDMYNDDPSAWRPAPPAGAPGDDDAKKVAVRNKIDGLMQGSITEGKEACGESLNRVLHRHLCYVGVAITPQNLYPRHSRQDSQGFACSRGGLNTILNTGNERIHPGQKIRIDFALPDHVGHQRFVSPSHFSKGTPHHKMLVQTHPVADLKSSDVFLNRILDKMHHLKNPKQKPDSEVYLPMQTVTRGGARPTILKVFFLSKGDEQNTIDVDSVDASLIYDRFRNAFDLPVNNRRGMNFRSRIIKFHAETTAEFKAKADQWIQTVSSDYPERIKLYCFHARHIQGVFAGNRFTQIVGGCRIYAKNAGPNQPWISVDVDNGPPLEVADIITEVAQANSNNYEYERVLGTDAMAQAVENANVFGNKPANSVNTAVEVAARAGDTLHYALSVMKRHNFSGYLGAKTLMADFVRDIVRTTMQVMQSENEQTIGVALSGANVGEPFDICLTDH